MPSAKKNPGPIVTEHAINQFKDRVPLFIDAKKGEASWRIKTMYKHGSKWGASKGDDFLIMSSHPYPKKFKEQFVLACTRNKEGRVIIKTVLTEEQAIQNMSMVFNV